MKLFAIFLLAIPMLTGCTTFRPLSVPRADRLSPVYPSGPERGVAAEPCRTDIAAHAALPAPNCETP